MAFIPAVPVVPPPAITEVRSVAGQRVLEGEQPQSATAHLESSRVLQIKLPQADNREQLRTAVGQALVVKDTQLIASVQTPVTPPPADSTGAVDTLIHTVRIIIQAEGTQ